MDHAVAETHSAPYTGRTVPSQISFLQQVRPDTAFLAAFDSPVYVEQLLLSSSRFRAANINPIPVLDTRPAIQPGGICESYLTRRNQPAFLRF